MNARDLSPRDALIVGFDQALRTVFGRPLTTGRPNPADDFPPTELADDERRASAGLMRVNHAGEVCAQALYQGQALTARLPRVRKKMEQASREENDHLSWCQQRLQELDSHTSLLNPVWYLGSFAIGATAGLVGDKWSLGFVAETERQVVAHLDGHLARLAPADSRSRAILEQMRVDEGRHATTALEAGGVPLPVPVKGLMSLVSRVMTRTTYYV